MLSNIIGVLAIIFLTGGAIPQAAAPLKQNFDKPIHSTANPIESILVFVSLNMPDKLLKRLHREVQNSKMPTYLLLKELYQNSIQKSQDRIKKLDIEVIIHPELFEENTTQSTPTFIFNKKRGLLILHGDLSLDCATAQAAGNLGHHY